MDAGRAWRFTRNDTVSTGQPAILTTFSAVLRRIVIHAADLRTITSHHDEVHLLQTKPATRSLQREILLLMRMTSKAGAVFGQANTTR